jgi:hypothetical protein
MGLSRILSKKPSSSFLVSVLAHTPAQAFGSVVSAFTEATILNFFFLLP